MSCCGKSGSAQARVQAGAGFAAGPESGSGSGSSGRGVALRPLEYVGETSLTVLGPATGQIYRFGSRGARLQVDPRDWQALSRLSQLKPVG